MTRSRAGKFRAIRTELMPSGAALGGVKSVVYQFNAGVRSWVIQCRTVAATREMGEGACATAIDSLKLKRLAKPLAFKTWRRKMNNACKPINDVNAMLSKRVKSFRGASDYESATMTIANNMHYLERAAVSIHAAHRNMAALRLPDKNRGKAKRYIRVTRQVVNELDTLLAAAGDQGEVGKSLSRLERLGRDDRRIGRQLGVTTCSG